MFWAMSAWFFFFFTLGTAGVQVKNLTEGVNGAPLCCSTKQDKILQFIIMPRNCEFRFNGGQNNSVFVHKLLYMYKL